MQEGVYKTKAGSLVFVRKGQRTKINFDWFEEENACFDCSVDEISEITKDPELVWSCDECEGGHTKLERIKGA